MNSEIFLLLFICTIAVITIFPLLLRKLYVPGVIALLLAGMLMGKGQLNLIHHLSETFSQVLGGNAGEMELYFQNFVDSLGSLGLVFLMALAGMEADFKLLKSVRGPVVALSILTFAVPAVAGFWVYRHFCPGDLPGKLLYASLFASHSVGIVFPVMRELRLSKTRFGAAILISTVVTDIASIILLAVSVQLQKQQNGVPGAASGISLLDRVDPALMGHWFLPLFLGVVVLFIVLASFLVWLVGRRVMHLLSANEDVLISFLLLVILLTVLAGEAIGINLIVSAFIAGLALSPLLKEKAAIFHKFEGIGYGFLIPFLFLSIGMKTDLRIMGSGGNLSIVLLTVVGLVCSKLLSGWLALRFTGFSNAQGICGGLMTVPQLSATLAAAALGKNLGMLNDNFFNAIIFLSIVTTIPIPSLVRGILQKTELAFETTEVEAYVVPEENAGEDDVL